MKQRCLLSLYLVTVLAGPLAAQSQTQAQTFVQPSASPIDWVNNLIRVQGIGRVNPKLAPQPQRLSAIRAATADAYRQLASVVGEVRILNEVSVGDYAKSKKIQISGLIQGARRVGAPVFDSAAATATVTLELPIYGPQSLASQIQLAELLQARYPATAPEAIALNKGEFQSPETYTSLIIDARQLGLQAQMLPALCSSEYCLVPNPQHLASASFKHARSLDQALAADQAAGDRPLVLQAQALDARGRLLFAPELLRLIQAANQHNHFFEARRVTLVL